MADQAPLPQLRPLRLQPLRATRVARLGPLDRLRARPERRIMNDLTALLDEMQARSDAAPPAPWRCGAGAYGNPTDGPDHTTLEATHPQHGWVEVATGGYDSWSGHALGFAADARTDLPRLIAALRAVLEEHRPTEVDALNTDCAIEECDCEGDCTTEPVTVCAHCFGVGEESHPYAYEQGGIETVRYPCPTVVLIREALDVS